MLGAFNDQVSAQTGKGLTGDQAALLRSEKGCSDLTLLTDQIGVG